MTLQHGISLELNQAMVGQTVPVLVESYDEQKKLFVGRSQWDAPGIDNLVYIKEGEEEVIMAEVNNVVVEEAKPYDLFGTVRSDTLPELVKAGVGAATQTKKR